MTAKDAVIKYSTSKPVFVYIHLIVYRHYAVTDKYDKHHISYSSVPHVQCHMEVLFFLPLFLQSSGRNESPLSKQRAVEFFPLQREFFHTILKK